MINIEIKGLTELQARLGKLPNEVKQIANAVIQNGAEFWVGSAKRAAPVRKTPITKKGGTFGSNLKQMINYSPVPVRDLTVSISSHAYYSPYMEWGTITRVSVPPELASYAIQFKGKGIRKTGGIFPRPFFFPQMKPTENLINQQLKANLEGMKL